MRGGCAPPGFLAAGSAERRTSRRAGGEEPGASGAGSALKDGTVSPPPLRSRPAEVMAIQVMLDATRTTASQATTAAVTARA